MRPAPALPGEAGAEDLAAFEPGDEDGLHRLGDEEGLAVHLLVGELDAVAEAAEDRVGAVDDPEALALAGLAPAQGAGGAHEADEGLREVAGVEHDEAHALVDPLGDAVGGGVVDLGVGLVAPPEEDVGVLEPGGGEAVLGLVEGGGGGVDAVVGVEGGGDGGVDAVGVDGADERVLALVDELVPDDGSDHGPPGARMAEFGRGCVRGV